MYSLANSLKRHALLTLHQEPESLGSMVQPLAEDVLHAFNDVGKHSSSKSDLHPIEHVR